MKFIQKTKSSEQSMGSLTPGIAPSQYVFMRGHKTDTTNDIPDREHLHSHKSIPKILWISVLWVVIMSEGEKISLRGSDVHGVSAGTIFVLNFSSKLLTMKSQ